MGKLLSSCVFVLVAHYRILYFEIISISVALLCFVAQTTYLLALSTLKCFADLHVVIGHPDAYVAIWVADGWDNLSGFQSVNITF